MNEANFIPPANEVEVVGGGKCIGLDLHKGQTLLLEHNFYITPGRWQLKTLILSMKVDKKSLETVF